MNHWQIQNKYRADDDLVYFENGLICVLIIFNKAQLRNPISRVAESKWMQ